MSWNEVDCSSCNKAIEGQASGVIGANVEDGWINADDWCETWYHEDCMSQILDVYWKHMRDKESNNA